MTGIRRECSDGYTGRCMFAIGLVDTFIRTPAERPSYLSGKGSFFGSAKLTAEDTGGRVAAAGFNPGDRAVLILSGRGEWIAADWLTSVWKQCAAGLPAVPHSPDGN